MGHLSKKILLDLTPGAAKTKCKFTNVHPGHLCPAYLHRSAVCAAWQFLENCLSCRKTSA